MSRKRNLLFLLSFLLPLGILLSLCALLSIAPFGSRTLVCADANNQFISYYAFYQDLFLRGRDWLYSFEKVLGGSTAGLFAYYLASPLNLLLLAFPGEKLAVGATLLILLKPCLCGLSFALYLNSRDRLRPASLLFSTAYALCGFNLAYAWCSLWLDAVILLPLVAWGIDRLLRDEKPLLYLFSLGLAILSCFYTGYMLCLFSALYALCSLLALWPSPCTLRSFPWRGALRFALASLCAGALSAVFLLPAVLALRLGSNKPPMQNIQEYTYPVTQYFLTRLLPGRDDAFYAAASLPMLAALCLALLVPAAAGLWALFSPRCGRRSRTLIGLVCLGVLLLWYATVERTVRCSYIVLPENRLSAKLSFGMVSYWEMFDGSPNVYIGQLCLLLAVSYFSNRAIPVRERRSKLLLTVLLLLPLMLHLPDLIWHGFEKNHCFNYRESFFLCFLLLSLAEESFSAPEGLRARDFLLPALLLGLNIAYVYRCRPVFLEDRVYLPVLLWLLLSAAALLFWLRRPRAVSALCAVQLIALCATAGYCLNQQAEHAGSTEDYASAYRLRESFSALAARNTDFYRARKAEPVLNHCDPLLIGYPSVMSYSSAENAAAVQFTRELGLTILEGHFTDIDLGSSRTADTLTGVRYVLADAFLDYRPVGGGFVENPYALPLAFAAPASALEAPASGENPCETMNRYVAALAPDAGEVFLPAEAAEAETPDSRTQLFSVQVETALPLYCPIRSPQLEELRLERENGDVTVWQEPGFATLLLLGSFEPGETLTLALRYESDAPALGGALLYYERGDALAALRESVLLSPCELRVISDSRLSGQVELRGEDTALVFLFPLEDGWRVLVDGEPVTPVQALGLYLAVPLSPGAHQVELRFVPPGLLPGASLSAAALAAALLWAWALRRRRTVLTLAGASCGISAS